MKKIKIAVIILHFGKWQNTKNCLDSFKKIKKDKLDIKIILVNNSYTIIKRHCNVNKLINNSFNKGFSQGNNIGIKAVKKYNPNYYLFLNNDTIVKPDFLEKLIKNLPEKNCISGPVIEHKVKNQTFYDHAGFINYKKGQPYHINKTTYNSKLKPQNRDFVSGCCLLVSKNIIDKIGGFRKDYFLYLEDVELCLRAKKHNFSTYLIPQSKIFHLGSQSATELTKIYYSWRNSFKLIKEYIPNKYKYQAYFFNFFFYPLIFLKWQVKRILH